LQTKEIPYCYCEFKIDNMKQTISRKITEKMAQKLINKKETISNNNYVPKIIIATEKVKEIVTKKKKKQLCPKR